MKKKALSLLLSSAMVVSLAACGSSSDSASTATDSNATSSTEAANAEASTTASTGETSSYDLTELNIVVNGTLTATVDNGQQAFVEQWEKAVSEELGHDVKLNIQQLDHSGYTDAVGRLFAGGDYPDAMIMSADMFKQYAPTGLLWDMADAYKNADFQSRMDLPKINESLMDSEGHLYGFANSYGNGCVTYVKKAWLDAVGINAEDVKTYDDYYNMLLAFHNGDPDGNGVDGDTYGVIAAGFVGNEAPYINYLPEFWQDAYPAIVQGEDGTWYDGFQSEETKAALLRLQQAYTDGAIDPETLTASTKIAREKWFSNDQTGSSGVFTYWAGTWATNLKTNLEANGKDGELVALPPIAEVGQYLDRVPPVWCITSACENPEGVFKYFIEPMQDGGDVQFLWTYGVEGIHWSTAAETLFAGTENEKTYADGEFHMLENREKEGTQYTKAHIDPMLALVELANDPQEESVAAEAKESAQLFNDNCKAADLVPTTDEMSEYNGDLTTLKNELIAKVVMGELTVDDAYAQFESNHGAEWSQAIVDSLNK